MADTSEHLVWGPKHVKSLTFMIVGAAFLGLAACGSSNQDAVQNAELNQPNADELNQLSNEAAMDANAEAAALAKQQQLVHFRLGR